MRLGNVDSTRYRVTDIAKIANTIRFKDKVEQSLRVIETFYGMTQNMAVSCGGGKDGTAVLILTRMITSDFKVMCADPPNPLTGRGEHINALERFTGIDFIHVPYEYDYQAVLRHEIPYPAKMKITELHKIQAAEKMDIIWGCRNQEFDYRAKNFAKNGYIYRVADGSYRCQPIAKWDAEDSIALILATGYPLNDVYEKMDGFYNLNDIHDGTWWPHGSTEKGGWIRRYYPEHYNDYVKALSVDQYHHRMLKCVF